MAPVIHVITVIHVINIYVVRLVPIVCPVFRPRINHAEPETAVLEPGISAHHNYRDRVDPEPVCAAEMRAEMVFRNTVTPVTAAFMPVVMFVLPMFRAMAVPGFSPVLFVLVPAGVTHVFRPVSLLDMWLLVLRPAVVMAVRLVSVFVSVLVLGRASVILFVFIFVLPVVVLVVSVLP
jgi:hypothetical protein